MTNANTDKPVRRPTQLPRPSLPIREPELGVPDPNAKCH